jgi:hypothetical protein
LHLLVLAYKLAAPHPRLGGASLVERHDLLHVLLDQLSDSMLRTARPMLWRGAFNAYLMSPRQAPGLPALRSWLNETLPLVSGRSPLPSWVAAIADHLGVLGKTPVQPYASDWWLGDEARLADLRCRVEIPIASWFFDELVESVLENACVDKDDARFDRGKPRVLALLAALGDPGSEWELGNNAISKLLTRHLRVAGQPRDQRLIEASVGRWGNPQLALTGERHQWSRVSSEVVDMVCGWLAEEDLQDFHDLCRRSGVANDERLSYWLRFKRQISYTRLAVSDSIRASRDPDVVRFRRKKGDRLASFSGAPGEASAIIIRLGDLWFVEFSETGNACYPYHSRALPFDPASQSFSIALLKQPTKTFPKRDSRLLHMRDWQATFDRFLSDQGIWPDALGRPVARPTQPVRTPSAASMPGRQPRQEDGPRESDRTSAAPQTAVASNTPAESQARYGALTAAGLTWDLCDVLLPITTVVEDLRSRRGALWIYVNAEPSHGLKVRMEMQGFRYAASKRAFWSKA